MTMPDWSLAQRSVRITVERGEGEYSHGSGCLVGGNTVLTAAHVVAGAHSITIRRADLMSYRATADARFVGDPTQWRLDRTPGPDLALLTVEGAGWGGPPIEFARIDRSHPSGLVERASAVGYPQFANRPLDSDRTQEAVESSSQPKSIWMQVPVAGTVLLSDREDGLLDLQVTITPALMGQEDSPWAGMSGAPVCAGGRLLGVINEHAPRSGSSTLAFVPLTAVDHDGAHPGWSTGARDPGGWWTRLGVTRRDDLLVLPPPREAPYRATMREIGHALHQRMPRLLGRDSELAELAAFTAGPPGYLWWSGGAYAGKSALLFEAVTSGVLPDNVDVVAYFVRARAGDADESQFLAAVVPQLELLCGEQDHQAPTIDRFNQVWQRACAGGRNVLLVLDGLDEDLQPGGSAPIATRLPAILGARGHVLVSSRPHPQIKQLVDSTHPLASCPHDKLSPFEGSEELAEQAKAEIDAIADSDDADIFGLLTAARGPLSIQDLAVLLVFPADPTAAIYRRVRHLVTSGRVGRSLEPVGSQASPRYQFAHELLVQHARAHPNLTHPQFRKTILAWADSRQEAGWPMPTPDGGGTPLYLLDTYPTTLLGDCDQPDRWPTEPQRHTTLLGDLAWIDTAIRTLGVGQVRAALQLAPTSLRVQQLRATIGAQADVLSGPRITRESGFLMRQIGLQALQFALPQLRRECAARIPDGQLVPVWSSSRTSSPPEVELGRHKGSVQAVAVLPDGRVVSAGDDGRVRVWGLDRPGIPLEFGSRDDWGQSVWAVAVQSVAVLPDGGIVTGGGDGLVRVWNLDDPSDPFEVGRHSGPVVAVAVLPDGQIVTGSNKEVWAWFLDDPGDPLVVASHGFRVEAVAVLPDGRLVTVGDKVRAVAVLPDGRIVTGGSDGRVRVWNLGGSGSPVEVGRHDREVRTVAVLPEGRIVSGGSDGRIRVWDLAHPGIPLEVGHQHPEVRTVAVLPEGRIVSGGSDGRVRVWDLAYPGPVEADSHDFRVWAVAVLPDGRIVTGGSDGHLRAWNLQNLDTPLEVGHHDQWVVAMTVLPDGRIVTGSSHGLIYIWDPDHPGTPLEVGHHYDRWVVDTAVLPDGHLVTGGSDGIRVWSLEDPDNPLEVGHHGREVQTVAVLPDGRVVTGGSDGRVRVWNLEDPDNPLEVGHHNRNVRAMAVLSDGRIVTGGDDSLIRVWDLSHPGNLGIEVQLDGEVNAIATSETSGCFIVGTQRGATLFTFPTHRGSLQRAEESVHPYRGDSV